MKQEIKISVEKLTIASKDYKLYGKLWLIDKRVPTILLLHGLGFYSFEYEELALILSENGFNCLAFDFRCHGKSDGKRGYWTLQELVDDTKNVVDYVYNKFNHKIGIFGNSLGATVGVYAVAEDKENKIKSLIASNCATRPADFGMNNFRKVLLTICSVVSKIIPFRVSVNHFIPYDQILSDPKIIKRVKNDKLISDTRRFAASTYKDMFSWDATKITGKVRHLTCRHLLNFMA